MNAQVRQALDVLYDASSNVLKTTEEYKVVKKYIEQVEKENQESAQILELYNEKFAGTERERADLIKENKTLKALLSDTKESYTNTLLENEKLKQKLKTYENLLHTIEEEVEE